MIVLLLLQDYNLIFNYSYWTLNSNTLELNNKCVIGYIPITLFISKTNKLYFKIKYVIFKTEKTS